MGESSRQRADFSPVDHCARLRAKEELLNVNLKDRIRRDIAMSSGSASLGRITASDNLIRGTQ
jgi:hypothetical protein